QHFDLFVAHGFAVGSHRRLHREVRQNLEQMILHHVADSAGLIVKSAAPLHAEILRHGDLHAADVVANPEGFEKFVGEAEKQHVMHRAFAQVVVDAKDRLFIESAEQSLIELSRRVEVATEGLLDNNPRAAGAIGFAQLFYDGAEQHRRDGEIKRRLARAPQLPAQGLKRRRVFVVAVDVTQQPGQLVESRGLDAAVLLDAVARPRAELIDLPAGFGHANDRHVEMAALDHRLQRRKNFLVGEIAGGAEKNQRIRMGSFHSLFPYRPDFSRCPPNSKRIAESSLSAKSASPRELKRSYRAALNT